MIPEELEFAVRQYEVATEHLIDTFLKHDLEVPNTVKAALLYLANAINSAWDGA